MLHIGAACVLGGWAAGCVSTWLDLHPAALALLCLAQPVGLVMVVVGSRMAPTSSADDRREKS